MKLLFRGTNTVHFNQRKELMGVYCGTRMFNSYRTSATPDLMNALVSGDNRCDDIYYQHLDAKPILIAINAEKYRQKAGLENSEIEIHGLIDFKDIIVIKSIDDLLKVCPNARDEEIDFFKKYYVGNE